MYRIGFIDDQDTHVKKYKRRFSKYDIELVYLEQDLNRREILNWVLNERLEGVLIDYKLMPKYQFVGSSLVNFLNKKIFDFPCMLLTSFSTDALDESLVPESYILKKSDMQEGIKNIANLIIQNIKVFRNRMELSEQEYRKLFSEYKTGSLDPYQIEDLREKYNILRGYHLVEEYDWSIVELEKERELDQAIDKLDVLIKKFEEIEGE
ncbi:hypothetical protein NSA39_07280 [Enterococcus gallinarum]|uniref:hypothetical protein n=1 Tax=Enterococcus gallinarum TaxID=1353 RepID=UPI00214BA396|nr:hypothetical protein [Enterococcus gallinarum]MCR1927663.1 hypothetical protein [Enterococcus gallinarum]